MADGQRRRDSRLEWAAVFDRLGLPRLPRTREVFGALPGVAAVGLTLLYAVGAMLWVAELQGVPVSVVDAMPLVPLEQILSRGIGTVILVTVILPIFGMMIIAAPLIEARVEARLDELDRSPEPEKAQRDYRRKLRRNRLIMNLVLLVAVLNVPPVWAAGTLLFVGAVRWLMPRVEAPSLRALFAALLVSGLVVALVDAFVDPRPRPTARLMLVGTAAIEGPLVVATDATWYVAPDEERIDAVPVRQIRAVRLSTPPRDRDSLLELVGLGGLTPF
jgi:hypothetical protein